MFTNTRYNDNTAYRIILLVLVSFPRLPQNNIDIKTN